MSSFALLVSIVVEKLECKCYFKVISILSALEILLKADF